MDSPSTNSFSRRGFLARSSAALAGLGLTFRPDGLWGLPSRSTRSIATFMPDVVDAETLRRLAKRAIEAATAAGASYADARFADRRILTMYLLPNLTTESNLGFDYSYGIRVLVEGTWGFIFGAHATPEGVAQAAERAVTSAKGLAKLGAPKQTLVPVSAATGEWATPVKIDPFSVSPDEHTYMMGALAKAARRVPDARGGASFRWTYETRVFASSDGAMITQRLTNVLPGVEPSLSLPFKRDVGAIVPGMGPAAAGFEVLIGPTVQERVKAATEEVARWTGLPEATHPVGRYAIVLDGVTFGAIVNGTLIQALALGRALGQDTDTSGTSFLAPVDQMLGQQLFGTALNITTDRAAPAFGAAKWDDEGVETKPVSVVEAGKVVDYFGTRATASTLAEWYTKRGQKNPVRGSAMAWSPVREPVGASVNAVVKPAASGPSLDDLLRNMGDGLFARNSDWVNPDQQLNNCSVSPDELFEVKKGQVVKRITSGYCQFNTKPFLKALVAVGNPGTVMPGARRDFGAVPMVRSDQAISAPAAHIGAVNLFQYPSAR